jgi:hypothetical protein
MHVFRTDSVAEPGIQKLADGIRQVVLAEEGLAIAHLLEVEPSGGGFKQSPCATRRKLDGHGCRI